MTYNNSSPEKMMKSKEKTILDRIKHLEDAISKSREFLENGSHAHWHGFKPIFAEKVKDDKILPPHKDWVKNVFLPSHEKALVENQKLLEKLTQQKR